MSLRPGRVGEAPSGSLTAPTGRQGSLSTILLVLTIVITLGAASYFLTRSIVPSILLLAVGMAFVVTQTAFQTSLGIFLMLIPLQWLVIALLQFNGISQYKEISALKEVVILGSIVYLLSQAPRLHATVPDVLLGLALLLVAFEQLFHTDLVGARNDWEWVIAYMLGRLLVLSPKTEALWAKCAVWMCAALAVLGVYEVEFLGSLPRLALLQLTQGDTKLPAPFLAEGFTGFRAASSMVSPLAFSGLCMVGLVLWWTYMKNPIPAFLIGVGLVFTLTRSAVVATIIAVLVIAIRRREWRRSAIFATFFVAVFLAAIPFLDLGGFLSSTFHAGADNSTVTHRQTTLEGFERLIQDPLGTGAGTVGPRQLVLKSNALDIENAFLTIGVEYGVVVGGLFVAFFVSCIWILFKVPKAIGYSGAAILVGFGILLLAGPLHLDVPLAVWVWVPVGMGISCYATDNHGLGQGDQA